MNLFKKALIAVLGLGLVVAPSANRHVQEVEAASERTIYLKPSGKETDGAWFAAWTWGGSNAEAFVTFADTDGDEVYETSMPSDRTGMKVLRMASGATTPSFTQGNNGYWNQSGNLTLTSDKNCWTWGSSWDGATGSWSTFTPTVAVTGDEEYGLVGSFGSTDNWIVDNKEHQLKHNPEKGRYEYTMDLNKDTQFKVSKNFSWDVSYGYDFGDDSAKKYTTKATDGNFIAKYTGTYTFFILDEDHRSNIKVGIEFNAHLQLYTQRSTDGTAVRFIGTFGDINNAKDIALYDSVGFEFTSNGKDNTLNAGYIYETVVADGNTISAEVYGAQYFFCITFTNVPANTEFTVTPFAKLLDTTVETGATYTFTA